MRRSLKRKLTLAASIVVPLSGVAAGGMYAVGELAKPQMDAQTFCAPEADQHNVAIFAEASFGHVASDRQKHDLEAAILKAYADAPANARFSFFTTAAGRDGAIAESFRGGCKPAATPGEWSALGLAAKPPAYLKRQAKEAEATFNAHTDAFLNLANDPDLKAKDSPVLEQLAAISKVRFAGGLDRLIVYSDGMQNTELARFCSHKGHMPAYAKFARDNPRFAAFTPESLQGVQVELLLVEHGPLPNTMFPYCTTVELRTWWADYFAAHGADMRLTPLRTGAQ
ncbi:MAG: hypothetical protein AAFY84_12755 [Pseudomonadota bacterium]